MPISLPVGPIWHGIKWLKDRATQWLFLSTYRHSHEVWRKRHRLGAHWKKCTKYIEYSLYLPHSADPEPRIPIIAFRAKEEVLDKLTLVFQAESDTVCFQEPISIRNLTKKPVLWKLQNVPHQELLQADERGIRFSWDEYSLVDLHLRLKNGDEVHQETSLKSNLTHTWFLNSEWENRWGKIWNLDVIQSAKKDLVIYWRFGFWRYGTYPYVRETVTQRVLASTIRPPIEWLMTKKALISIQFWLAIWSGMWFLNEDRRLDWRWRRSSGEENKLDSMK